MFSLYISSYVYKINRKIPEICNEKCSKCFVKSARNLDIFVSLIPTTAPCGKQYQERWEKSYAVLQIWWVFFYFFTSTYRKRRYGMNECHDASQNFVNQATFSFHFSYFCSVSLNIYSTEVQDVATKNLRGGGRIPRI